jgi:hypothetical protein
MYMMISIRMDILGLIFFYQRISIIIDRVGDEMSCLEVP